MKHITLLQRIVITTLLAGSITAREFRTPIPLLRYMLLHTEPLIPSEEQSQLYGWGGYYQRKADTFRCNDETRENTTSEKCPLSALLFNRADFTVNDIFVTQNTSPINILFSTTLSPRVKYIDRGAVFGFTGSYAVNCNVVVGGRVAIPFRNFNMKLTQGPVVNNQIDPAILAANVREGEQTVDGNQINSYAYRLSFLSTLPAAWTGPGINFSTVDYRDTEFLPPFPITISTQNVTDNPQLQIENRNPVTVIKTTADSAPSEPFALPLLEAQNLEALAGDGLNAEPGDRRRFITGTDYLALGENRPLQQTFWVVPTINGAGTDLVDPADIIEQQVDDLIGSPATAIAQLFESAGISLASQKHGGLGDIDTQFFAQYWWNPCSFVEGNLALRLPTAGAQVAPGLALLQPLGNNGHPEIMIGARGYWHDYDWIVLQADALYSVVLKRTENVAMPLQGSPVKNIGTGVPAHINWQYFLGHAEIAAYPQISCNDYAVLRLGYELYHKTKDSISLQTNACTCIPTGTNQLNANNLETNTRITAHKLYGEAIVRHEFDCITAGIFANVGGVVGGKNTPQETEWYVGLEFFI